MKRWNVVRKVEKREKSWAGCWVGVGMDGGRSSIGNEATSGRGHQLRLDGPLRTVLSPIPRLSAHQSLHRIRFLILRLSPDLHPHSLSTGVYGPFPHWNPRLDTPWVKLLGSQRTFGVPSPSIGLRFVLITRTPEAGSGQLYHLKDDGGYLPVPLRSVSTAHRRCMEITHLRSWRVTARRRRDVCHASTLRSISLTTGLH